MAITARAADLQSAIHAALAEDAALVARLGGLRIHDQAPANAPFPYITLGHTSIYDWSTGTENGAEQLLTLHIWSKSRGEDEARELMDAVAARLNDAGLALESRRLVSLRLEFSEIIYDEDLAVHHGLLRFRAVTEPA